MKGIIKRIVWTKWKTIRTIWPYPSGWGVYRQHRFSGNRVILETGLSKEDAQAIADYQNKQPV